MAVVAGGVTHGVVSAHTFPWPPWRGNGGVTWRQRRHFYWYVVKHFSSDVAIQR